MENSANSFLKDRKIPLAVIGLRRIGKTELIQKFRQEKSVILGPYLNLQGSVSSPQTFAQDFYLSLLQEIAQNKGISFIPLGEKREQITNLATLLGENIHHLSLLFLSTLEGKDYVAMIQSVFRLPQILADIYEKKIIFFLDEFQELEDLNNYRLGDVFKIMRTEVEKQTKVMYILAGSIISFMEKLIKGSREPFFNQFIDLRLSYFTKEDSVTLIKKLLKSFSFSEDTSYNLFKYTAGHPFYITAVCERLILESSNHHLDLSAVKYALLKETLDKGGKINILFRYIFEESLKKAKRKGYLKNILLILAEEEGLNLTVIAEKLKKPSGQVNNYLKSLLKTDLVFAQDRKYFFRDNLFRFWLAKTQLGKDMEIERKTRFIEDLLEELKEKYLRTATELGRAKEAEIREKLKEKFGFEFKSYKKEGIEFDALGYDEKKKEFIIGEIKHRNKPTNYKDVRNFLEKIKLSEFKDKKKKLFFISKAGFTRKAKELIEENNIQDLEDIFISYS